MAYPNYPQMYYPQYNYQPQQNNSNGIIWVQGEAGAKSYLVAPNTTVQLWDSEKQTIYLKSADTSGMPTIKTLDYTIRENENTGNSTTPNIVETQYATKTDLNALKSEIEDLKHKISGEDEKPDKSKVF